MEITVLSFKAVPPWAVPLAEGHTFCETSGEAHNSNRELSQVPKSAGDPEGLLCLFSASELLEPR